MSPVPLDLSDPPQGPDQVRLARTSDVDDVARVQVAAWRTDYPTVLPARILDSLNESDMALEWGRALLTADTDRLLVAINGSGVITGAATIGPCRDGDLASGAPTGEIGLFIIDPAHRGLGHGSRLLSAAVDHLRGSGCADVVTWTPLVDEPRRAFFTTAGFGPDSAYRDRDLGENVLREVRLISDITDVSDNESVPETSS